MHLSAEAYKCGVSGRVQTFCIKAFIQRSVLRDSELRNFMYPIEGLCNDGCPKNMIKRNTNAHYS